ncbi:MULTISPECIES: M23 family metallopeptidase [unclassified Sedimentibacter]|uniref:M23 family metallopeptidase n=1 Tax=unclassified Sedimentibacter TaxID=2649220 RepID=UPI0027DEDD8B|nr:M23 family metallopeptidase [Sedimentibacter sp. MB35-C1]WMJ78698.1 M23 family metallopeptidase [Sedimentibacter sp. MB35-C1]
MHYIYFFSKYAKWLGIIAFIGTLFSNSPILKMLCLFGLFVLIEMTLDFSVYKCSFLQVIGMFKVNKKYKNNMPSVDNYKCKVEYDLPFKGKWTAVNGCFTKEYSHSWGIPTQRYAYDFIILDENGKSYNRAFNQSENYYCYDRDVLSPADGVIVEVLNNAKDSLIFKRGQFYSRAKHIAGNYVVIKHDKQEYSTLAHLKEDSISVEVGETVSRGQPIAKCGNTGNSTEPHLHFQLQTGQSFYSSAGLPIHFRKILLSNVENYEKFDSRPHMEISQIPAGYVTRGFNAENLQ